MKEFYKDLAITACLGGMMLDLAGGCLWLTVIRCNANGRRRCAHRKTGPRKYCEDIGCWFASSLATKRIYVSLATGGKKASVQRCGMGCPRGFHTRHDQRSGAPHKCRYDLLNIVSTIE